MPAPCLTSKPQLMATKELLAVTLDCAVAGDKRAGSSWGWQQGQAYAHKMKENGVESHIPPRVGLAGPYLGTRGL